MPAQRILHIFPSFDVGGVQNRIVRVINALPERYNHTIVALDGSFAAGRNLRADAHVEFRPVALPKTGFISFSNVRRVRTEVRDVQPDLMVTYNWGATEWAVANRLPRMCRQLHFESGFGPDEVPDRQHWRRIIARRLFLSRCERIVVPSMTLSDVATRVWRMPARRILYLPNGIDCSRFAGPIDTGMLQSLGIPAGVPVVGTVSALRPEKNLLRLIRAFTALPVSLDARLLIVGDGPEAARLRVAAEMSSAAKRIIFAGHLDEPSRLLRRIDVFAITSDTEQMPNSVLEAMAAGLPVVATDVGDINRMVSRENAPFVLPIAENAGLVSAMLTLLQDVDLARRVGAANLDRVKAQFSFETMVTHYDQLYSTTIGGTA